MSRGRPEFNDIDRVWNFVQEMAFFLAHHEINTMATTGQRRSKIEHDALRAATTAKRADKKPNTSATGAIKGTGSLPAC